MTKDYFWALVTLIIAIILAILLLSVARDDSAEKAQAQAIVLMPAPSQWDATFLELDKRALDEAYKNRILHLFDIWMRDEVGQPERAVKGATQARRAYIEAMKAIEFRKQVLREREEQTK